MTRIRLPRGEWFFDEARRLGRPGGFGEVFEGEDPAGRRVAVKRLKVTAAEAAHRELAIADELAGRALQHVLVPLDSGLDADSGAYFVVMPQATRSLADDVAARSSLPAAVAVDVLRQIAAGLQEIPKLVHRDLKPDNVLLHEEHWKVADFGIARFLEDATSLNTLKECLTPPFAAPEQWNLEHATPATDVYALGCIAHVLFSGKPPFPGPTPANYRQQHLFASPPALASDEPRIRAIVLASLRKPPASRPSLERVAAVLRVVAESPRPPVPAVAALLAANEAEGERLAQDGIVEERTRIRKQERLQLFEASKVSLRELLSELQRVVRENAPEAKVLDSLREALIVSIGRNSHLRVRGAREVPPDFEFRQSHWNPIAISRVQTIQGSLVDHFDGGEIVEAEGWSHGATLWYMSLPQDGSYRWYEVSYKRHALVPGPRVGPFAIQSVESFSYYEAYHHADAAAGPGMHTYEIEFGPTPIDDEAAGAFVERWLSRLVQAFYGRLAPA